MVGCWHGYLSGAKCRLAYGPADATVSCFSEMQIGFTFLVPAHPGNPGQRAVKWVYVCMYDFLFFLLEHNVDTATACRYSVDSGLYVTTLCNTAITTTSVL